MDPAYLHICPKTGSFSGKTNHFKIIICQTVTRPKRPVSHTNATESFGSYEPSIETKLLSLKNYLIYTSLNHCFFCQYTLFLGQTSAYFSCNLSHCFPRRSRSPPPTTVKWFHPESSRSIWVTDCFVEAGREQLGPFKEPGGDENLTWNFWGKKGSETWTVNASQFYCDLTNDKDANCHPFDNSSKST